MKLNLLAIALSLGNIHPAAFGADPPWRAENLHKSLEYFPNVIPPPLIAFADVGFTYASEPGTPVGWVGGDVHIIPNNSYTGDWNAVSGAGRIEFDFVSQVDAALDFNVGGSFGSITMTVDGDETVWQYPTRVDPIDAIMLPPGNYHFLALMQGTGQGPGWGRTRLGITPVPEPCAAHFAAVALLFALAAHRRTLKGLRFHAGRDASGVSGEK